MAKRLHKGDESQRRSKIMTASRTADASLLHQLRARLASRETYDNKRHIVRALGKIGGPAAEAQLIRLLSSQRGLILGDIAHALGQLRARRAAPALRRLCTHRLEWVRQNADFALHRLARAGSPSRR